MNIANLKYEKYFQLGKSAFLNGKPCIPVKDKEFITHTKNRTATVENFNETTELSKAWIGGWTIANIQA
jgi:hypothetical protein